MNNEIIKFVNGDLQINVTVSPNEETVWLNRNQLASLFDRDVKTISKHINNALKEELDSSTVAKFATVQKEGSRNIKREIDDFELEEFTKNECCNLFSLFLYYHYSDIIGLKEINING